MRKLEKGTAQLVQMGIFLGILLTVHAFISPTFGDDVVNAKIYGNQPLLNYLVNRYHEWSSRVFIEAVMMPLVVAPVWVWRVLNTLMVILLVWNVADLFGMEGIDGKLQAQRIFFVLLWLIPIESLGSAGVIATTVNYLWPLTLGIVAIRPLRRFLLSQQCRPWEYVLCPLCAVYAANMEQMAAILLGTYLALGMFLLVQKKRLSPFYVIMLLIMMGSLCFILTAPGNSQRVLEETEHYFPEFQYLTVYQKLEMGFLETVNYFVAPDYYRVNGTFAILTGVLFAETAGRQGEDLSLLKMLIALCPLTFYWLLGRLGKHLLYQNYLTRGLNVIGLFGENRKLPEFGSYGAPLVALQAAVYLILLMCVALTIFFLHGRSHETLLQLLILLVGILSRVIVGFSPTIYASEDRTALFASAALLIVALRNMQIFWRREPKVKRKAFLGLYLAVNVVCTLI